MNIVRTLLAASIASVLGLGLGTGIALAQDQAPPSCAEAQLAFTQAQLALDAAVDADKAAADAKAADEALAEAKDKHDAAVAAAVATGVAVEAQTQAEIDRLELIPSSDPNFDLAQRKIAAIKAVLAAKSALEVATSAALTDATALQEVADQTDAEALAKVRNEARLVADEACKGEPGDPGAPAPNPVPDNTLNCDDFSSQTAAQNQLEADIRDPHNLDSNDNGVACEGFFAAAEDNAPVPSGGVDTGDGSSL